MPSSAQLVARCPGMARAPHPAIDGKATTTRYNIKKVRRWATYTNGSGVASMRSIAPQAPVNRSIFSFRARKNIAFSRASDSDDLMRASW
eukprot:scaffold181265_cov31-Tisochrysis_lutea.AAC.1